MENLNQQLSDYLDGKLTIEQAANFEARLSSDIKLQQQLAQLKSSRKVKEVVVEAKMRSIVDGTVVTRSKGKTVGIKKYKSLLVAAGFLLGIALVAKLLLPSVSHDELYAQYNFPERKSGLRGDTEVKIGSLNKAIQLFELRQFESSKKLLLENKTQHPNLANKYLAHISFLEQDYNGCIQYFDEMVNKTANDEATYILCKKGAK